MSFIQPLAPLPLSFLVGFSPVLSTEEDCKSGAVLFDTRKRIDATGFVRRQAGQGSSLEKFNQLEKVPEKEL